MKEIISFTIVMIICATGCSSKKTLKSMEPTDAKATEVWTPIPAKVTPGPFNHMAPSDATILFNGSDLNEWQHLDGKEATWLNTDNELIVKNKSGDIQTKQSFGDCQLHLEWKSPSIVSGEGQNRGNSGIFLQERYEVQVLDSYDNNTYVNGQASAIYKQSIPLVNACKQPGVWQTYDIIYKAPVFEKSGKKVSSAFVTVIHNGVLTQNHVEIKGTTEYIGYPKNIAHGEAPIKLQDHDCLVGYRNIWVRRL
jgi:hypothetical protein